MAVLSPIGLSGCFERNVVKCIVKTDQTECVQIALSLGLVRGLLCLFN